MITETLMLYSTGDSFLYKNNESSIPKKGIVHNLPKSAVQPKSRD